MNNDHLPLIRKLSKMTPVMWGLLIAFIITTLITAYLTFLTVREVFGADKPEDSSPQLALETPEVAIPLSLSGPLQDASGPTPQPWDGANRVNILLMGLDLRDWEGEGPSRTDTMLLFTLDPVTHSAGMLSIPRDLWVNIPGFEYGKINTAYYLGAAYDVPGGGPGLAIKTVEELLGIPINYYAQIDFEAFERLVDEIGGIEVNVPEEISVDPLGPHNTVNLEPGIQLLDGPTALAYARNRDTIGGDFDRAERTQQVILAVRDRVLSLDMLPTLISKAPILFKELAGSVHTNMTLEEAIKLAWLAQQISPENIQRAVIGVEQVTMTMSADGLDILQPDPDAIRLLRDEIFTISGPISPVATATIANSAELMQAENASVSILNATRTAGLAAETTEFLLSRDINVTLTDNAQEESANTVIIDYTGNPYTIQFLVNLLNIQASNIYSRYDPNSEVDIAILLGEDWANDNSMP
jgi:polyisoprenyl-teichoic acid--peptidoglycan teichoic acid transferase